MSELLFYSSIFILLSNTGGREITKKVYEFWSKGSNRQDIAYVDLEDLVSRYQNNSVAQPFSGTTFNSKYSSTKALGITLNCTSMHANHCQLKCVENE